MFRTLFYVPLQIPIVASTIVWLGVLHTCERLAQHGAPAFGIEGPDWINSTTWVYPALSLMGLWGIGNMMLIFLAGLQGVPTELYDAARVDGAGVWGQFRHVTLPMISPVLFYNLIIGLIGTFQYFTQAFVLTNGRGDPNNATLFFNLNLYREALEVLQHGLRGDARVAPVRDRSRHHDRPVPDFAVVGLRKQRVAVTAVATARPARPAGITAAVDRGFPVDRYLGVHRVRGRRDRPHS